MRNNARVGSEIAVELARMRRAKEGRGGNIDTSTRKGRSHGSKRRGEETSSSNRPQPVVIGGSILDLTAKVLSQEIVVGVVSHKEN